MRLALILTVLLLLGACADAPADPSPSNTPVVPDSTADLARFFPEGTAATFVLYDAQSGLTTRYNPERSAERRTPASTFKIFNSLVALDAGAVADEHEVFERDGVERWSSGWNESQDLATAFQRSTVWIYQEIARRIGRERMQTALTREGYGNAVVGDAVDMFWLDGSLRISADEQVDFLRRLHAGDLGFSEPTMNTVKRIMVADTTGGAVLHGKTGWALREGENLGWWVGWIEQGERVHFFATQIESDDPDFDMRRVRKEATDAILLHLGVR